MFTDALTVAAILVPPLPPEFFANASPRPAAASEPDFCALLIIAAAFSISLLLITAKVCESISFTATVPPKAALLLFALLSLVSFFQEMPAAPPAATIIALSLAVTVIVLSLASLAMLILTLSTSAPVSPSSRLIAALPAPAIVTPDCCPDGVALGIWSVGSTFCASV